MASHPRLLRRGGVWHWRRIPPAPAAAPPRTRAEAELDAAIARTTARRRTTARSRTSARGRGARHGYRTPAQVRADQLAVAVAA